ncbi:hypothetical protein B0H67DRAFT_498976, partial [Lasiosphaeris hirsuta]
LLKLHRIGLRNAARFEYNYQSHITLLDMSESRESRGHSLIRWRVNVTLNMESQRAVLNIDNAAIRERAKRITCFNTASIYFKGKLHKIPDSSESWTHVEQKATDYIRESDGKIRVVFIIDAHYPSLGMATHLNREVTHDDHLHQQPSGQVKFYLSNFLSPKGLSIDFCRPPARTSRSNVYIYTSPFFTISYQRLGAIFRTARHVQHPDVFAMAEEDMETNLFEEMQQLKRRTAETKRRIAEERRQREESDKRAAESDKRAVKSDKRAAKLDKRAAEDRRRIEEAERRLERVIAEAELRVANAEQYAVEERRQRKEADKRATGAERRTAEDIRSSEY